MNTSLKNIILILFSISLFGISGCKKEDPPDDNPDVLKPVFDEIMLISPEDSTSIWETEMKLIWHGPRDSEFDIFLGKDSSWVKLGSTSASEYKIPNLIFDQDYLWQIKTIGEDGDTISSPVRTFTFMLGNSRNCYPYLSVPQRYGFTGDTIKFIPCEPLEDPFMVTQYTMSWDFDLDGIYELEDEEYTTSGTTYNEPGFYRPRLHLKDKSGNILQYTFAVTITTKPNSVIGYFMDERDGQIYRSVQIGNQTWMAHNLNYHFVSNDSINGIIKSHSVVGGEGRYGRHYVGLAAQNSCPEGWHLPDDEEWIELERYLGMPEQDLYGSGRNRGAGIDDQLKAVFDWREPDQGTNNSGFGALPSGYWFWERSYLWAFYNNITYFASRSENNAQQGFYRSLHYEYDGINRFTPWAISASVRCLKDE